MSLVIWLQAASNRIILLVQWLIYFGAWLKQDVYIFLLSFLVQVFTCVAPGFMRSGPWDATRRSCAFDLLGPGVG